MDKRGESKTHITRHRKSSAITGWTFLLGAYMYNVVLCADI